MTNPNLPTSGPAPRPFSVWIYLLMVFGLSWPFLISSALWATDLAPRYVLNASAMMMVTVGTFIAGKYVFRDGFAGAGWSWGQGKHYLWVAALLALLWIAPTLVDWAAGNLHLPARLTTEQMVWVPILLFVTLIPGFGEEFGWRGYMLPRLARRLGPRQAVAVQALIWWAWHLPIVIGVGVQAGVAGAAKAGLPVGVSVAVTVSVVLVVNAITAILHGVVFAYIWVRSQSLAVSTVYHAGYDGVRDSLSLTVGLGALTGLWANLVLVILGVFFLVKGDWRGLKAEPPLP